MGKREPVTKEECDVSVYVWVIGYRKDGNSNPNPNPTSYFPKNHLK